MRIAVGADHAGFELKQLLAASLREDGHHILDLGTDRPDVPVDYPDFGVAVAGEVTGGRADFGVCVCGTGIGISMAANKVPGARAAVVHDVTTAALARRHNHANVLCFGGRTLGPATALDALNAFLVTIPEHGRHDRRVQKLDNLDSMASTLAAAGGPG
jgi:ribose 5-phosphate isomerase B